MKKGNLIVMVGLPGSGKSTAGSQYGKVCSSDDIREELYGDAAIQYDPVLAKKELEAQGISLEDLPKKQAQRMLEQTGNQMVFDALNAKVKEALMAGEDVVYDATSISRKNRARTLQAFAGLYDKAIAVFVNTPLITALQRNRNRTRKVPEDVICRMARQLEPPVQEEGFDEIIVLETGKETH